MGLNPMPFIAFVFCTMFFQAIVVGEDFYSPVYEPFEEVDASGIFGFIDIIGAILATIWGAITLLFQLITFGAVDEISPLIRVPLAAINSTAIVISIVQIIRGN